MDFIPTEYMLIITSIITIASAIAALTPTPKEGSVLAKIYKVIDWAAINVGKAKDSGDK